MEQTTRHISPLQFATLLTTSFLGIGIFEFPRLLVRSSWNDALYGFMLDVAVSYVGLWLMLLVARLNPSETLLGFSKDLLSNILYWPFGVIDTALHLLLPIISLGQFSYLVVTFFLPNTAIWAIEVSMILVSGYIVWWELPALARTTQLIYILVMLATLVLSALLIPHATNPYALIPSTHIRLVPILIGAYKSIYIYLGFEVVPLLFPYVRKDQQKRAVKYAYLSMAFASMFYLIILGFTLTTEDPWFLIHLRWPAVSALRLISVSGLIINKLGLLIVVLWGLVSLFFVSIRLWAISHVLMPMFGVKSITWYRGFVAGLSVVIVLLAQLFPNIIAVDKLTTFVLPFFLIFVFGYPPIFFLLKTLRHVRWNRGLPSPDR